jgi:hypothetical protein
MGRINTKIKEVLNNIGLFYNEPTAVQHLDHQLYPLTGPVDKLTVHRDFLVRLQENEDKRLESIDSKTSQLIAQTGIIFSLLGLFLPVMMDKATELNIWIKSILIALLILAACFYLLTIHNALRNYRISKYRYGRPGANNVINFKDKSTEEFIAEEIRDILSCINLNIHNNNRKGTNLLHSYAAFKIANLLSGGLIILAAIFILFYQPFKETVNIDDNIKFKGLQDIRDQLKTKQGDITALT